METIKNQDNNSADNTFATKEAFVKAVNAARLSFKGTWYGFSGTVDGKTVRVKAYGRWLQVLDVNGIRHGESSESATVGAFKEQLTSALDYSA
jgi:hypothetical protein